MGRNPEFISLKEHFIQQSILRISRCKRRLEEIEVGVQDQKRIHSAVQTAEATLQQFSESNSHDLYSVYMNMVENLLTYCEYLIETLKKQESQTAS